MATSNAARASNLKYGFRRFSPPSRARVKLPFNMPSKACLRGPAEGDVGAVVRGEEGHAAAPEPADDRGLELPRRALVAERDDERGRPVAVGRVVAREAPPERVGLADVDGRRARDVGRGERVDAGPRGELRRRRPVPLHLGSTREIQRRFNVSVPHARVPEKASTLRDRSER